MRWEAIHFSNELGGTHSSDEPKSSAFLNEWGSNAFLCTFQMNGEALHQNALQFENQFGNNAFHT